MLVMSDVLEVRPGTVRPEDLAVFERVLEQTPRHVRGTPCLVGPDGVTIELPADIHALLMSIIENLKAGNGVTVIPMHAEAALAAMTVEAEDLGLYDQ